LYFFYSTKNPVFVLGGGKNIFKLEGGSEMNGRGDFLINQENKS